MDIITDFISAYGVEMCSIKTEHRRYIIIERLF